MSNPHDNPLRRALMVCYPVLFVVQCIVGFVVMVLGYGWLGLFIIFVACWHIYVYAPYRIEYLERLRREGEG